MNPELESFKRTKHNSKHNPKIHQNMHPSPKTQEHDSAFPNKQFNYEPHNFYAKNEAQPAQFHRPYSNRNSINGPPNQYGSYMSETGYKETGFKESYKESYKETYKETGLKDPAFKGMVFDINGEKLRIHNNESLNDANFIEKVEFFFKKLKIPKKFEEEALMIKIVRELERNGWTPMEKWKYHQILDSFISNSVNLM